VENQIIIKAFLFEQGKIRNLNVKVSDDNQIKVKRKLELVQDQIINLLKKYKKEGKIGSIWKPRDVHIVRRSERDGVYINSQVTKKSTKFQIHLNEMVNAKREIKKSISSINTYFK